MLIAIAAENKNIDSLVSHQAARAPYFLLFKDGELVEAIKNVFSIGGGGAGWSVAHLLADKKVDLFLATQIGNNMRLALEEKGIKFKQIDIAPVNEVIKSLN